MNKPVNQRRVRNSMIIYILLACVAAYYLTININLLSAIVVVILATIVFVTLNVTWTRRAQRIANEQLEASKFADA